MEETVVKAGRRLDTPHAAEFSAQLKEAAAAGCKTLIVDMAETIYISSVCLRELLSMHKKMKAAGGVMLIRNAGEGVMEVFDVTGFSGFLAFEGRD